MERLFRLLWTCVSRYSPEGYLSSTGPNDPSLDPWLRFFGSPRAPQQRCGPVRLDSGLESQLLSLSVGMR